MISSYDYYKQIESPNMYLCNPDKRFICALNGDSRHLVLRFNDLAELTFTVPKIKESELYYNLVETKRLIFLEKIGWFQITDVAETTEGNNSYKEVIAKSHQYSFKDRGFVTEERIYMFYNPNDPCDEKYDSSNRSAMPSVIGQLHKQLGIRVSLNNSNVDVLEDREDWTIVYIDPILKFISTSYDDMYVSNNSNNVCRGFEENTSLNGYDFMINQVENAFEVVFDFDFLYHTIKIKTLDAVTKPTNIYLAFDNIVNRLNIKENAEDIVTVMSCNGNNIDIRTVNPMGTNYIVNFDYYKKHKSDDGKINYPWMSKSLIEALDAWETEFNKWQVDDQNREGYTESYSTLVQELQLRYADKAKIEADIQYANLKLTVLQVARDQYISGDDKPLDGDGYVTAETVNIGNKSLLSLSKFNKTSFVDDVLIMGHAKAPTLDKGDDGNYTFTFADEGTSGTPKEFIQDFIDSNNENDIPTLTLYFMDEDDRSYCKLIVDSEVGVVKDNDGNIANSGSVEVRDVCFNIVNDNGAFEVAFPDGTSENLSQSNSYFIYNGSRYRIVASADGIVSVYAFYVSGFERYTTYAETAGKNGWCSIWENHINHKLKKENDELQAEIDGILEKMKYINSKCNIEQFIKNCGDNLYDELSHYWIEGDYHNDNIAAYDTTSISERIDFAKELMKAGEIDLKKCSQPQFEMSVDAINFIKMYEFRQFTKELILGRTVTIEKNEDVYYRPALMTIEYDLDMADSFSMTFSNASKPGDTAMTFADLIKESSSTSRTVAANWSNLTDYTRHKETITDLIESPLNRTLRVAQENMAAQAFVIDDTGILGRKYDREFDSANGTFLDEQIRIIHNNILFTKDNWETASLALGKITLDDGIAAYGLVADVLVGNLMLGSTMKLINPDGTILLDGEGITIKDSDGNDMFKASTSGGVYINGYATKDAQDELAETLRQEFVFADGELSSTINETLTKTLDDYSKKSEVESKIEQTVNSINLSVNKKLESYSTTEEVSSMIKVSADEIKSSVESLKNTTDTIESTLSTITQRADSIEASVTDLTNDVTAKLKLYVAKDDKDQIVSMLNASANVIELKSNRLLLESDNFKLDENGTITATAGKIGNLALENGNLTSTNFKLETIKNNDDETDKRTQTYLTFINGEGELSTTISDSDIFTPLINTDDLKAVAMTSNTITIPEGLNIKSKGLYANKTYIELDGSAIGEDFVATLEYSSGSGHLIVKTDKLLNYGKSFGIRYKLKYKDDWYQTRVGISAKSKEGYTKVSAGWGFDKVGFILGEGMEGGGTQCTFKQSAGESVVKVQGAILPSVSGKYTLGDGNLRWANIYCQDTNISSSDAYLKEKIEPIDNRYSDFFDKLQPKKYKWITGERMHLGFIAQEIKAALDECKIDTLDYAGYCSWVDDSGKEGCGIRIAEIIPLCVMEIQKLKKEIKELSLKYLNFSKC